MLSIKDFSEFEIKNMFQTIGGTPTSHSTWGADHIETDAHGSFMMAGNVFLGCGCPGVTSFSSSCCPQK